MVLKRLGTEQGFKTGIVSSTIFGGLSKVLLFFGTWLATFYFGTTQNTDLVYFLQNTQVQIGGFILAVNMAVVIPRGIYLSQQESKAAAIAFYNTIFLLYALIGIVILLLFLVNPVGIAGSISKFPADFLRSHQQVLYFMPVAIFLNFLYQLINDVFTSFRRFTLPLLINTVFSMLVIIVLVVFHQQLNEYSYLLGIVSALVLCLLLQLLLLKQLGWHFKIDLKLISRQTISFMGYAQLGQLFTLISTFLPFYFLSGEAGALSAYNIVFQLISLPSILVSNQFSVVAGIKFTEYYARQNWVGIDETFKKSCLFLLYISFPIAALLCSFGGNILQQFVHFSSKANLELATDFCVVLALTIPVNVINNVLAKLLMASQKIKIGFYNQVIQNSFLIALSYLLYQQMGPIGLPMAILISQAVVFFSFYIITKRELQHVDFLFVAKWFGWILLLNGGMFFGIYFIRQHLDINILSIILISIVYLTITVLIGLSVKEIKAVIIQPLHFLRN